MAHPLGAHLKDILPEIEKVNATDYQLYHKI